MTRTYILLVATAIISACSTPQKNTDNTAKNYTPVYKELYKTIARIDSILFDAFNNQDLNKQKSIFSTDIEFYHDKGGVTNYNQIIENTQRLINQNLGLRRILIPGSLEVYPIKDYGAIEIGTHQFCHQENGKDDCGTFKFVHIWQKKNGIWKLTRVISYDH
ncbi:nuclear transport factor 2 family protein [Hymenobacter saemangeumensis]